MLGLGEPVPSSGAAAPPPASTTVLPQLDETSEDGPVFRATLGDLEKGVLAFRKKVKHLLRSFTHYVDSNKAAEDLSSEVLDSMRGLNILLPATTYLEHAITSLDEARAEYLNQLETLVIQPLKAMTSPTSTRRRRCLTRRVPSTTGTRRSTSPWTRRR